MASVIIADDSVKSRNILARIVRRYNRDTLIDEVGNGRDLVKMVRTGGYAFVITDNNMPELTGLVATEQIRAFNPQIPICMITASDSYDDAMRVGVTDYIPRTLLLEMGLLDLLSKYI